MNDEKIRPEVKSLIVRGNITLAEYKDWCFVGCQYAGKHEVGRRRLMR